jgi:ketosteroid isomerase-like protein
MYHTIVRTIIVKGFKQLSNGNAEALLNQFAPDVHYRFEGQHALGGERSKLSTVRAWFQRMLRLFPGLQFRPMRVIVSGWPWNTTAAIEVVVSASLQDGQPYENRFVQFLNLRWGKVVDVYTLENLQKLTAALERLSKHGVEEATAPAIEG